MLVVTGDFLSELESINYNNIEVKVRESINVIPKIVDNNLKFTVLGKLPEESQEMDPKRCIHLIFNSSAPFAVFMGENGNFSEILNSRKVDRKFVCEFLMYFDCPDYNYVDSRYVVAVTTSLLSMEE